MGTFVNGGGDVGHNNPVDMTFSREVDKDWLAHEINGLVTPELPPIPDEDGDYTLQISVDDGEALLTWEEVDDGGGK